MCADGQSKLKRWWHWFEIERRTDILALTAFIISSLTAIYQVGVNLIGPDPRLIGPEGVTLARFENRPGTEYVSVVAPVSVANLSNAREPLLVTRQTATLEVGEKVVPLTWHDEITAPIVAGAIDFIQTEAVHPFVIETRGVSSRLIRFTPQRSNCRSCDPNAPFVGADVFGRVMQDALQSGTRSFKVTVSSEFANHRSVTIECVAPLLPDHLRVWREYGYFMELCSAG